MPSITKEGAKSFGLILTFSNGGGGRPDSNYVNFYQDFMCTNYSPESTSYIWMVVTYYTDNEEVGLFNWNLKEWSNRTDYGYDITDDYGQKIGVDYSHYEFDSGKNYISLKKVSGKKYFDGDGFKGVTHTYDVLVERALLGERGGFISSRLQRRDLQKDGG